MDVLIVLTSHGSFVTAGLTQAEFAAPYYVLIDAGADVALATPLGGLPAIDVGDEPANPHLQRYRADDVARSAFADTLELSRVYADDFDAVFFPGGYGVLWDLVHDSASIALLARWLETKTPIALVGHAPAALFNVSCAGSPVLAGRRVTAFSNSEEARAGYRELVPFLLQDEMVRRGAVYSKGRDGASYVVRDGQLITGQNAASAVDAARALHECVGLDR